MFEFDQSGAARVSCVGDVTNSWKQAMPDEENRVFKFDQSEAVYIKFSVDDKNNCVEKCRCIK